MPFCWTCTSLSRGKRASGGSAPSRFSPRSRYSSGAAAPPPGMCSEAAVSLFAQSETVRSRGQSQRAAGTSPSTLRSALSSVRDESTTPTKPRSRSWLWATRTACSSGQPPKSRGSRLSAFLLTSRHRRPGMSPERPSGSALRRLDAARIVCRVSGYPSEGSAVNLSPSTLSSVPSLTTWLYSPSSAEAGGAGREFVSVWKGAEAETLCVGRLGGGAGGGCSCAGRWSAGEGPRDEVRDEVARSLVGCDGGRL